MNEKLILNNIKLINYTINKMGLLYDFDDYYEAGMLALINASKNFDETKGYKFSSYAITCIKNELLKHIRSEKCDNRRANYNVVSLNQKIENGNDTTFIELFADDKNLEEEILKQEKIELLKKIIDILEPKDKFMMEHYFELWGNKKMEQKEIAKILNVKQSYVSYRIKRAMRIIKKIMEDKYENN